jgi:hypothetical protein
LEKGIHVQRTLIPTVEIDSSRFEETAVRIGSDDIRTLVQHPAIKPEQYVKFNQGGVVFRYILGVRVTDAKVVPSLFRELKARFNLDVPVLLTLVHYVPQNRLYVDAEAAESSPISPPAGPSRNEELEQRL